MVLSMLLTKRDGCARIGKIVIDSKEFELPLLIDFLKKEEFEDLLNSMDFGLAPYVIKDIDSKRFDALKSRDENFLILTGLKTLSPKRIVEEIFKLVKNSKPIYTPALATPINLPLLIYLGIDIVDNILPIVDAYNGIYYTNDSKFKLQNLKSLPCNCPVCLNGIDALKNSEYEERSYLIALHNTYVMKSQIELIKETIRNENLRNFVEAKAKLNPELTVILRIADNLNFCYEFHSAFKKSKVYFNTLESFNRPEVKIFFERALKAYKPKTKTLLILPCSAKKPYLLSKTHKTIRRVCKIRVNEIIVSSPLVVPREFELVYPAINYDTPVTGHWSDEEISFVAERLREFVDKGNFERIIAHVENGYRKVVERALKDYNVEYTCNSSITSQDSLKNLKRALENRSEKLDLYKEIFEHMVRYQFDLEMNLEGKIRGKYPELELINSNERVLRVNKNYGMLDIYRVFAEQLIEAKKYVVKIGDFDPKGTIFAIGIENADERIRPNDLVVFYNDKIFGVAKAIMAGIEMVEAKKGMALIIKRKWNF